MADPADSMGVGALPSSPLAGGTRASWAPALLAVLAARLLLAFVGYAATTAMATGLGAPRAATCTAPPARSPAPLVPAPARAAGAGHREPRIATVYAKHEPTGRVRARAGLAAPVVAELADGTAVEVLESKSVRGRSGKRQTWRHVVTSLRGLRVEGWMHAAIVRF
jgi:hypothetical protein